MSGTKVGAAKAVETNKRKHGEDFFVKIGSIGGKKSNPAKPKGFAADLSRASWAGKKGGRAKAGKKTKLEDLGYETIAEGPLLEPVPAPKWYQLKYKRMLKRRAIR